MPKSGKTNLCQKLLIKVKQLSFLQLSVIIVLFGFLIYANSLSNGFVWDDEEQIVNNSIIHNLGNWPYVFGGSTFNTAGAASLSGVYYKPLMPLSFMLNFAVWGLNAFGYHFFQLLIHLANATLVFYLVNKILSKQNNVNGRVVAFLTTLFWVIHPGINEAVVYLSSTQEVLFTFFSLLALIVTLRYLESRKLQLWLLYSFFLLLGLLSKESAITIVPITLVYFYLFAKNKLLFPFSSSIVTGLIYAFLRFVIAKVPLDTTSIVPISQATFGQRLTNLPFTIFSYFRLLLFPKDLYISQHFLVTQVSDPRFWGAFIFIIFMTLFLVFITKKIKVDRWWLFFILWFGASLTLVLNLFPLDMSLAERWLYFTSIGFFAAYFYLILKIIIQKPKSRIFITLFTVIAFILLSYRTVMRNQNWQNGLTLYSHDIQLNPEAMDLQNNYGTELFRAGQFAEAKIHFEQSIVLAPDWTTNYSNLGAVYEQEGNQTKAEELYKKCLENGDYYMAIENLASLYLQQQKYPEAIAFCQEQLQYRPYNLKLSYILSLSLYQSGKQEEALSYLRLLYQNYPKPEIKELLTKMEKGEKLDE